jgi:hypothetical protein
MDKFQAVYTLKTALMGLFPYKNHTDDPDKARGEDQRKCEEALDLLSAPSSSEMPASL